MPKAWPAALVVASLTTPALAADVTGEWFVEDKTTVIRVQPCPAGMCGYIAWGTGPAGGTDKNNADPTKRNRTLLGMQFITMKASATPNRFEGEIYNAKDGKTYSGSLTLVNEKTLRIEGCVLGFLCGGENWARAKCDEAQAASAPPGGKSRPPTPSGARATTPAAPSAAPIPTFTSCRLMAP